LDKDRKKLISYFFFNSNDINIKYLKNIFYKEEDIITFDEFVTLQLDKIRRINTKMIPREENISQNIKDYFLKITDFEDRESQIKMAEKIYDNFFQNKKTVIEAPTGI
jgi:hypothetical protein